MLTLTSPQVVQETALRWKREYKVAFIPTMGCLHEGHLALILRARQYAPKIIVSIFVNPLQFGPSEDFSRYPRTLEEDQAKLQEMNVDVCFAPSVEELYPDGFETKITAGTLSQSMEGAARPGHFDGVATVCLKLFQITQADFAIFGEKDFQQLRIIQQMAADLNLSTTIIGHPTVRDPKGLALSSRNRYLSASDRELANRLPISLQLAKQAARNPQAKVKQVLSAARESLGGVTVDYLTVAMERDLKPVSEETTMFDLDEPRIFAAVRVGTTRLIDNLCLTNPDEHS